MRRIPFVVVVLTVISAQAEEFHVIPDEKSGVSFKAQTTFHDFIGRSTQVSAHFALNDGHLDEGEVTVPVESISTGNDGRDRDMRSGPYLAQQHHPNISYRVTGFSGSPIRKHANGTGELQGTLSIRGVSKPTSIPMRYHWSEDTLVVSGEVPLDIRDFGMKPPTVMLVQRMDPHVRMRFRLVFANDSPSD